MNIINSSSGLSEYFNSSFDGGTHLEGWQKIALVVTGIALMILTPLFLSFDLFAPFRRNIKELNRPENLGQTAEDVPLGPTPLSQGNEVESIIHHESPSFGLNFDEIAQLITNAGVLSPDTRNPLSFNFPDGHSYKVWYNDAYKVLNIQLAEDFSQSRPANKLGISIQGDRIKVYFENDLMTSLDEDKRRLIEVLPQFISEIKETREHMQLENQKFNTDSLRVLRSYFQMGCGRNYTNQSPLGLDDHYMWYRSICETSSLSRQGGASRFILNLQKDSDFSLSTQYNKLGISVNGDGEVESVYVDGREIEALDLFKSDHIWNKQLVASLNVFLRLLAVTQTNQSLTTHSVAIARQPEFVLSKVRVNQSYNFYTDALSVQPGIDAGGLKRQFLSELALYLFDGTAGRKIKIESGVPSLGSNPLDEVEALLKGVGRLLFYPCFQNDDYTLGRLFDDSFFETLNFLISNPNIDDDDTMISACELLYSDEHPKWLFEVYRNPRLLDDDEKMMLESILCVVEEVPTNLLDIKQLAKETIVESLGYGNRVRAAKFISDGMKEGAGHYGLGALEGASPVDLSNHIQGIAIARQDIANRIYTSSSNSVIREKTGWLKEYILEIDEDEIRRFLVLITGSPTVTAATRICVDATAAHNCSAHTCFKSLDVPDTHTSVGSDAGEILTDKQKFISNFRLTYTATGFDMG